jgi:type I restriction-modification system DNA methylase subunit
MANNMISKEEADRKIASLVERFEEQKDFYKRSEYNETLTRRDFIDPFFKALGWDIDNELGYAESYREVIHEDRIKIGGATKAPDYSFRLGGGKRLFFVEAKKPSVLIKNEITPAYQVRRYGWSAKLPISLITDFEEFAVYDCTKKPNIADKASHGRIKYFTYDNYLEQFDFIWNTFSKEKVLKGSFDKFIHSDKAKKGTATVDHEFLHSLDTWRTFLANNIALRNNIDEDELNFVVQQIIDRIIFLRIAEDRSIERYGNLQDCVTGGSYYGNLLKQFHIADQKYNSGLFDFSKDRISGRIDIDNKVIKSIISDLYYPVSPYEFSVISVEILGSAYEQFLGKTISLSKNGRAVIEEKPEVRKAGGVYYTPEFIVDYIVRSSIGKLIAGKAPKDITGLKIIDPACGSGSFLIGAYQHLLDFHKDFYTKNGKASKGSRDNPLTPEGNLTTAEKKRILLNNIFGVDLDTNAAEVTKLSLLLKCMEGETEASIATQLKLFHERVLPSLDNNIKNGNSLIDIDYYDTGLNEEHNTVKAFNWKRAFPEVFKSGGFDCVIGNPPYGAHFSDIELKYLKSKYTTSAWRGESYLLFIEKGLQLLKPHGKLGLIIPDTLLNLGFTQPARELLLRHSKIQHVVRLPSNVFSGATVDTIILLTEKLHFTSEFHDSLVQIKSFGKRQNITNIEVPSKEFWVATKEWYEEKVFNLQVDKVEKKLLRKLSAEQLLVEIADIYSGIKCYEVGKGTPAQTEAIRESKPYTSSKKQDGSWMPLYDGKHIGRYQLFWNHNNWIKYGNWLAAPRNQENFAGEKILIRKITGKTLIATYVPETSYCNTLLFVLKLKTNTYNYKSVLAILNSPVIGWYFRKKFQISDDDTFPQIMIRDILQFPIPFMDSKIDNQLTTLVDRLLKLNFEILQQSLETKASHIQNQIDSLEQRINQTVYQLYGLTEEEIGLVEDV